jgi:hypothetical protein
MSEPGTEVGSFVRQVRARSREHREAMPFVIAKGWNSIAIGILRQELDSMVRVIYLLAPRNRDQRVVLIHQAVSSGKWDVLDKKMVGFAGSLKKYHWAKRVYDFGSGFIHLSSYHDYQDRDPFHLLPEDERSAIARYLREYHPGHGEVTADSEFGDIAPYVPLVLEKIASRLEELLDALENDRDLSDVTR